LLAHPLIDGNVRDDRGTPAYRRIFYDGQISIFKMFVRHGGMDFDAPDSIGRTMLWDVCANGALGLLREMIAHSRGLCHNVMGRCYESDPLTYVTPLSIASKVVPGVDILLSAYIADPMATRHAVRFRARYPDTCAAELFALVVLFCDFFVILSRHQPANNDEGDDEGDVGGYDDAKIRRFLVMLGGLPMELQMVTCLRLFDLGCDHIAIKDFEGALRDLARFFSDQAAPQ